MPKDVQMVDTPDMAAARQVRRAGFCCHVYQEGQEPVRYDSWEEATARLVALSKAGVRVSMDVWVTEIGQ